MSKRRPESGIVVILVFLALALSACTRHGQPTQSEPVRVSGIDVDAAEPAISAAPDGSVYLAWVEHHAAGGADVMLAAVAATGKSNGPAIRVNPTAGEARAWRGDPPALGVAPDGTVYVTWTARVESGATDLYLSASRDKGQSFELPAKVNDARSPGAHGMHSLAVAADGTVFVSWLQERNGAVSDRVGKKGHKHGEEANRELFVASSNDGGKTLSAKQLVAREVCPCCKTSLATAPGGSVYVSWRQVLPGDLRHIAVASSSDQGKTFSSPVIVSDDRWTIAGCPVSGSSLSVLSDGTLQVLWYSAGEAGPKGIYHSKSQDGGKSFAPRQLIAEGQAQGTPVLLPYLNGAIAIWQGDLGSNARVISSSLDDKLPAPTELKTQSGSELPAASLVQDQILVAYIQTSDDRRSVWLLRQAVMAGPASFSFNQALQKDEPKQTAMVQTAGGG